MCSSDLSDPEERKGIISPLFVNQPSFPVFFTPPCDSLAKYNTELVTLVPKTIVQKGYKQTGLGWASFLNMHLITHHARNMRYASRTSCSSTDCTAMMQGQCNKRNKTFLVRTNSFCFCCLLDFTCWKDKRGEREKCG